MVGKIINQVYFISLVTCILVNTSCLKSNSIESPKNNFTSWPLALDSFLNSIPPNTIWRERKIPDTLLRFSEIKDTFYIRKVNYNFLAMAFNNAIIDTVSILYYLPYLHGKKIITNYSQLPGTDNENKFTTIILNPVRISSCEFGKSGNNYSKTLFEGVVFKSNAYFYDNWYNERVLFKDDIFYDTLTFYHHSVKGSLPVFYKSEFHNGIRFNQEISNGILHGSTFRFDLLFNQCIFTGKLDLSYCTFDSSKLVFHNTGLPDTLDLSFAKFSEINDFTTAYPNIYNKKCEINLLNTDIEKVLMQYRNFHLYFPDSVLKNPLSRDVVSSTYELLLNNFARHGFKDSYETLDIEYKKWQSSFDWTYKLSDIWWKFGYQKWRILVTTFLSIFLFSIFNHWKYYKLQRIYPVERLEWTHISYTANIVKHFLRKYFATFLYTGLIFFRFSIDFKNINLTSPRYLTLIIIQHVWGLVCTGYLLNWIFKG